MKQPGEIPDEDRVTPRYSTDSDEPAAFLPGDYVWHDLAVPRLLSEAERHLAEGLAAASGIARLVRQVGQARVVGECRCGCPSVRLAVDGPVIDADTVRGLSGSGRDDYLSVSARSPVDDQPVEVTLHVLDGLVEELEIFAGEGVVVSPEWAGLGDVVVS